MAYKIGYASSHKELLVAVQGFLCHDKKAWNITADVANTGDGYVSAERVGDVSGNVDETWTLTATSATNFTVTGSVTGAQAAATVGTPYDNGYVLFTIIAGDTAFVAGDEFTFEVADGIGLTEVYTLERWNEDYDGSGGYEAVLKGPGTAGDDEIYTAIQTVESAGDDYYNWRVMGMTGYSDVEMQYMPGITPGRLPRMLMWNQKIKYWLAANGRRYIVVANISTVYQACYLGFALPFGLPTQFPYPLVVGGAACPDTTAASNRYSSTNASHRGFANPYAADAGVIVAGDFDASSYASSLKILQGTDWIRMYGRLTTTQKTTNPVWPYSSHAENSGYFPIDMVSTYLRENIDGSYPVYNAIPMISSPSKHIVGPLQGVFALPGFGGIAAEDTFSINGDTYVAFPIVPNADRGDFWALKLE